MRVHAISAAFLLAAGLGPAAAYDETKFVKGEDFVVVTDWRTMSKETRTCKRPSFYGDECSWFSGGPIAITAKDGQKFACSSGIARNSTNGTFACQVKSPTLLKVTSGAEARCPEKVELNHEGNVDLCREKSRKIYP